MKNVFHQRLLCALVLIWWSTKYLFLRYTIVVMLGLVCARGAYRDRKSIYDVIKRHQISRAFEPTQQLAFHQALAELIAKRLYNQSFNILLIKEVMQRWINALVLHCCCFLSLQISSLVWTGLNLSQCVMSYSRISSAMAFCVRLSNFSSFLATSLFRSLLQTHNTSIE